MKQTNNAIKFLMAQYRAIFKNANIAMLAAIAASALAAGQAQAAAPSGPSQGQGVAHNDWTTLTGDITIKQGGDTMAITGHGDKENANPFSVTVQSGGAVTIKGSGAGAGNFVASKASFLLDAKAAGQSAGTPANATLTIGGSTAASDVANVTVGSVVNKVGTINITGSGASATSSLSAGTITLGAESAAENDAVVNVSGHGILNATGTGSGEGLLIGKGAKITVSANGKINATTITMTSGTLTNSGSVTAGTLNLAGGTLTATKAVSGKTIKVTGGTVDFGAGGAGALGSDTTELITISGGTIDAKTAAGAIKGKIIKFEKGDIKASKNELTIDGGFEATGGTLTIGDQKSVTFKGNASIADAVTVTLEGTTAHTIKVVGTNAENNGKLSVSSAVFKKLTDMAIS